MAFLLTGVEHKTTGDNIMSVHKYETTDGWKEKYHRSMDYAISREEYLGMSIKVFDYDTMEDVFMDNWVRGDNEPEDPDPNAGD